MCVCINGLCFKTKEKKCVCVCVCARARVHACRLCKLRNYSLIQVHNISIQGVLGVSLSYCDSSSII